MKKILIGASILAVSLVATRTWAQTTLAQWIFESGADSNAILSAATPGANNPSASIAADNGVFAGSGSAYGVHLAGAATYSIPAGDLDPSLSTPVTGSSIHSYSANVWNVNDYWQFTTTTLGYTGINVAWDQAGSNTGPGSFGLWYSVNGGAYVQLGGNYAVPLSTWNTTTAGPASESFAEPGTAWDGATTLSFRLIDMSSTSVNNTTVAAGGTDRVDNFTVSAIPEPSTVLLVGLGLAGALAAMRRRS